MQLVPVYCSSPSVNPPPYIDCNFIFDLTIFELNRGWVRRRNPPRLAPNNLCLLTTRRFGSCSRHQHSALINCVREGRFYEEDPIESNEIKKSTKTPEERRKEIEVRVDAARLLQQKSESSSSDNVNNKGSDSTLGSGQRSGERRKHGNARKNGSSQEQRNEGKICLESRSGGSWFATGVVRSSWIIVREHIGIVLINMQMVLPESLHNERIELLLSSPWKPLDLPAAVKMLCSQKTIHNTEFNEFHSGDYMEDGDYYFQDAWILHQRKKILEMLATVVMRMANI
ncbi:hypothetical protein F2Q69_00035577 [Brassica cretica]|uniref:DUF629 domain-containing protein n=1 Tax=Brassica cretica TaxID=69181 RepID=A0A8S9SFU0_BRACR|nr:hypothetical protein F2Q69_00035577 [Brassica cretica]